MKLAASQKSGTSPLTVALLILPLALIAFIFLVLYPNEFRLQSFIVSSGCGQLATTSAFSNLTGPITAKPDFRIFIGVVTRADLYERRHFLRLAYSVQPKIPNVEIDVRFVFCRLYKEDQQILVPLEIMAYNDIIIIDCPENMNEGKTYTYFASLPSLFNNSSSGERPYDYVMKVDDDTYVRLPQLAASLRPLARVDMYYGAIIPCESKDPFHEYMSGMGYLLSWDLVEWISKSEMVRNNTSGPEDMMTGMWLRDGNKAKNRYGMRPVMYDYPVPHPLDLCSHELVPETVAVHRLKDNPTWAMALKYFNATDELKPSKFYNLDLLVPN